MKALEESNDVDTVFASSQDAPQLIYIHSATCPTSDAARREMLKLADKIDLPIHEVVVQNNPPVSAYVEKKSGVQHESPQALLLYQGSVYNDWDHQDISVDTIFTEVMQLPAI